ncbi:DarT ssDNA thymidine ADP-ribosyltransferase family protein [Boudabousia marimammalium]|uniref:DarT domain-containing protein n=1 Tax=Boudabousia marimammalium TaxID=156892 RepID=A0A1Q5PL43_9ACTO|nr:DarT ssDNA thymidine ADP-ribosyltransferase family protein [Boudabousia marimammalium]OKL47352.1 hypothetical protein BM477_06700 [Boudabousia marimammalium]
MPNRTIDDVIAYLEKREVEHLVHFTRVSNLPRIIQEGIVPRGKLESERSEVRYFDELRLDQHRERSCFSVSFPNLLMMYKYSKEIEESKEDDGICILFIPVGDLKKIAKLGRIYFYHTNAANAIFKKSSESVSVDGEDIEDLFRDEMSTKQGRTVNRTDDGIPCFLTTDPQAEVQIDATVPFDLVKFVSVKDIELKLKVEELLHRQAKRCYVYQAWKVKGERAYNVFGYPKCWHNWYGQDKNGE